MHWSYIFLALTHGYVALIGELYVFIMLIPENTDHVMAILAPQVCIVPWLANIYLSLEWAALAQWPPFPQGELGNQAETLLDWLRSSCLCAIC